MTITLRRARLVLATALLILPVTARAQQRPIHQDEAKVPRYTLPDPLVLSSGERIADASAWTAKRRPEVLNLFETQVYGKTPRQAVKVSFQVNRTTENAVGGKAIRKEVTITFGDKPDGPKV